MSTDIRLSPVPRSLWPLSRRSRRKQQRRSLLCATMSAVAAFVHSLYRRRGREGTREREKIINAFASSFDIFLIIINIIVALLKSISQPPILIITLKRHTTQPPKQWECFLGVWVGVVQHNFGATVVYYYLNTANYNGVPRRCSAVGRGSNEWKITQ